MRKLLLFCLLLVLSTPAYAGNGKLLLGTYSIEGDESSGTNLGVSFDYSFFADKAHTGFMEYHLDPDNNSVSVAALGYRWYHTSGFYVGGGLVRVQLGGNTQSISVTTAGINLGYDYRFRGGFTVGGYFGYTMPRETDISGGRAEIHALQNLSLTVGYHWE